MFRFTATAFQAALLGRQRMASPGAAPKLLFRDALRQTWRRTIAQQSKSSQLLLRMSRAGRGEAASSSTKKAAAAKMSTSSSGSTGILSRAWVELRSTATRRIKPAGTTTTRRGFHFSRLWRSNAAGGPKEESLGFSARMKKLFREYGWATVGVYAGLTILDFPFCFLLVRTVGTDKIAEVEHWVISQAKEMWYKWRHLVGVEGNESSVSEESAATTVGPDGTVAGADGWGVKEAQERNRTEASLGTQLALAYAIHKSFIFIRVPLTAAITPRVVKTLRSWGWQIGKRRAKR